MGWFRAPAGPQEPGAVTLKAGELAARFGAGERFRLVALPYMRPLYVAEKMDGRWPLIVDVVFREDAQGPPVLVVVRCEAYRSPDGATVDVEGHEVRTRDRLEVVPA